MLANKPKPRPMTKDKSVFEPIFAYGALWAYPIALLSVYYITVQRSRSIQMVLYPPRGTLNLTLPWGSTPPRA